MSLLAFVIAAPGGGSGAVSSVDGQTGAAVTKERATTANSTGNSTITPTANVPRHANVVTVTGSAGTRVLILATTGRSAGDEIDLDVILPDTAAIVIEIRNATAGGTLLYDYTTVGDEATNGYHLRAKARYTGSAWEKAGALLSI